MKTISLKHFAQYGKFDSIAIGSYKSDVINLLGDDFDFYDDGVETQILKYGWYEFFFWSSTEKLFGIQNDHLQADCINHDEMIEFENQKFKVDNWFLQVGKGFTFREVLSILETQKIEFEITELYEDGPGIIKFASGVYLDFSGDISGWDIEKDQWLDKVIDDQFEYLLNGIRLFDLNKNS